MDRHISGLCARKNEVHLCAPRAICGIADKNHAGYMIS
jgi:hypothetical protein